MTGNRCSLFFLMRYTRVFSFVTVTLKMNHYTKRIHLLDFFLTVHVRKRMPSDSVLTTHETRLLEETHHEFVPVLKIVSARAFDQRVRSPFELLDFLDTAEVVSKTAMI